jgi:hypothetical protein
MIVSNLNECTQLEFMSADEMFHWVIEQNKEKIQYDDKVYCVELPKWHTLYVRRNGKCTWSGNCRSTTAPVLDGVKVFGQRQAIADENFRTEARNLFLERETNRGTSLTDAKAMWHDKSLSQVTHYRLDAQKKFNSAMGGVPIETNYSQWLKGLSEREQVIALGKTKAKLFRSGDYKLTDFVSKYNKNLTLEQIYRK